ncbi:MAG: hypothetical protein NTW75_10165 [Planctomycetales bacterium]|jgi:hypothetical protein|nr:hypothetical protein [Planctomycetales bacterium]
MAEFGAGVEESGTEVGGVLSAQPGWLETSIDSPGKDWKAGRAEQS